MGEISVHTLVREQGEADTSLTRNFFQQLMGGRYNPATNASVASQLKGDYRGEATDAKKLTRIYCCIVPRRRTCPAGDAQG